MGYDPPGLEERPDDRRLAGFGSLMPEANSPPPGFLPTVLSLPFQFVKMLLRVPVAIVMAPFRLLGRLRPRR